MKKITGALTVLCILIGAMMTVSCNMADSLQQILQRSYNKWYKYTGNANLGDIPLGSDEDAEEGAELNSLKNAEYYFYYNPDDGLTLAIQAKVEQQVELLKGLATTKLETYAGGTKEYPKEEFGIVKWTALISNIPLQQCEEPEISANPEKCIKLYGEGAGDFKIQWKKVLAQKLLTVLLGNYLDD